MALRIFTTPRIKTDLTSEQLALLVSHFKKYLATGECEPYFGRDWPLDRPFSVKQAELKHTHVHPNFLQGLPVNRLTNKLKTWSLRAEPRNRTSDTWLIFCKGEHSPDNYLFVAFFKANAHLAAEKVTLMAVLAEEAEKWRRTY